MMIFQILSKAPLFITHQQALCGKILNISRIIDIALKIVNSIPIL